MFNEKFNKALIDITKAHKKIETKYQSQTTFKAYLVKNGNIITAKVTSKRIVFENVKAGKYEIILEFDEKRTEITAQEVILEPFSGSI